MKQLKPAYAFVGGLLLLSIGLGINYGFSSFLGVFGAGLIVLGIFAKLHEDFE